MEFPDLGKRCSWSFCQNLDFLPLTCAYCNQLFCKDHFNQDTHECKSFKKVISVSAEKKSFVCSNDGCTNCSPVEMFCQKCHKHFCLAHRYHDFYNDEDLEAKKKMWLKPEQQFDQSIKSVNDVINEKLKKAKQDPKKQATALKIQLMRLKGKAEGDSSIQSANRIYFLILLPKGSKKLSKPIFINKDWTVGKVIDSLSNICNIINKNNESNAPKLRLFKASDGCQISAGTSVKISDLIIKGKILNGETLILEYVDPKEDLTNFNLCETSQYPNLF